MCSGLKALLEFLRRQPYDTHALLSRALPGENLNTALGNIKNVGEQRDHSIVGFVVLWRRRDFEHERIATRPTIALRRARGLTRTVSTMPSESSLIIAESVHTFPSI
jgi:hypothetical protein